MNLESIDFTFTQLNEETEELLALQDISIGIERHGLTTSSFHILKSVGLLSGACYQAIALETITGCYLTSDIKEQALESLADTIKEKMTTWSAKIITFFKDKSAKVVEEITKLFNKMKAAAKNALEKVTDKINETKTYAKAHPYKTIAGVLAAALTVIGIVMFTSRALPAFKDAVKIPAFIKTISAMIGKIKWPIGKITTAIANSGTTVKMTLVGMGAVALGGTAAELHWHKDSISAVVKEYGTLEHGMYSVWDGVKNKALSVVKDGYTFLKGVTSAGYKVGSFNYHSNPDGGAISKSVSVAGGMTIGAFSVVVVSAAYLMYQLIKNIVVVAFRMACMTMIALGGSSTTVEEEGDKGFL